MPLEDDLIHKGYLPENLPPVFFSDAIADAFDHIEGGDWWSDAGKPVRPAIYNASKRGMARRPFSVVHPATMRDLAKFVSTRWDEIRAFFDQTSFSLSLPRHIEDGDRAIAISSHSEVETIKLSRLSQFRFIAKTDISRFYHSIYTHSIPWAFHGKAEAKADRNPNSKKVFFNRADFIMRFGQDGQTIGIPVGPDTSRILAETVATAIDTEFKKRCDVEDFGLIRHVDDVWIGANSHAEVERALWRYREAIREFELDINENKTRIYSSDFQFMDRWPTDLSIQLGIAIDSNGRQAMERLRAALEQSFSLAVDGGDDGVLKYAIRYLDRHDLQWSHWEAVEPFLKRALVHFGHTVDYVTRVIVWRYLAKGDLDISTWGRMLMAIIDRHGRIGNDSEVCWAIYACMRLHVPITGEAVENVFRNCGPLAMLSLLNCIELGLVDGSAFERAHERLNTESGRSPFWPVLMEWKTRRWPRSNRFQIDNDVIQAMAKHDAVLIDKDRLPTVFNNIEEADFNGVLQAIEPRTSIYDDDDEHDSKGEKGSQGPAFWDE